MLLALLVAGGAVGTSAYLGRRTVAESAPPTSTPTTPSGPVTCRIEPCQVVASTMLGSTRIELIADAGNQGARLKIGDDRLVESRLPARGATLGPQSLFCVAGSLSACLIRGATDVGTVGEVVVGRSGKWNATVPTYLSTTEYMSLTHVIGDPAPELVTVHRGYFARVYALDGADLGCTGNYPKPERLPGWPNVKPDEHQLRRPCP